MSYTVTVPWQEGDSEESWDETCIWTLEFFGLPGDRYVCHPRSDGMDFVFNDRADSIIFAVRWGRDQTQK